MKNIPFKSSLDDLTVDERNFKFAELSAEAKKQEIAFDALKSLIIEKRFNLEYQGYWDNYLNSILSYKDSKSLQECVINLDHKCGVCAKGALMLSRIRIGNTIDTISMGTGGIAQGYGDTSCFDTEEWDMLERVYEGMSIAEDPSEQYELEEGEDRVTIQYPYDSHTEELLANICCNIIQNKGFDAYDITDYVTLWDLNIEHDEEI